MQEEGAFFRDPWDFLRDPEVFLKELGAFFRDPWDFLRAPAPSREPALLKEPGGSPVRDPLTIGAGLSLTLSSRSGAKDAAVAPRSNEATGNESFRRTLASVMWG